MIPTVNRPPVDSRILMVSAVPDGPLVHAQLVAESIARMPPGWTVALIYEIHGSSSVIDGVHVAHRFPWGAMAAAAANAGVNLVYGFHLNKVIDRIYGRAAGVSWDKNVPFNPMGLLDLRVWKELRDVGAFLNSKSYGDSQLRAVCDAEYVWRKPLAEGGEYLPLLIANAEQIRYALQRTQAMAGIGLYVGMEELAGTNPRSRDFYANTFGDKAVNVGRHLPAHPYYENTATKQWTTPLQVSNAYRSLPFASGFYQARPANYPQLPISKVLASPGNIWVFVDELTIADRVSQIAAAAQAVTV